MIDLHCHLLPGIDDGAESIDQALAMARLAVANGITHALMTPHIQPGRYDNAMDVIAGKVKQFQVILDEAGVPLRIGVGSEVRVSIESLQMIVDGQVPYLGELDGFHVLLLEFPHGQIIPGTEKLVAKLLDRKIRPMIAHPERNKDVIRKLEKIRPFVEAGCMLQVTAGSVAGNFGEPARQTAMAMLENGWVDILASDAHDLIHRPPELEPGRRAAASIVGEAASWEMVKGLPQRITSSQFLIPDTSA